MEWRPDRSALTSRLTRWVRRRRRGVAGGLAALGVLVALTAILPQDPQSVTVLAAARDLQPGEVLSTDALAELSLPASAVPPGAVPRDDAVGHLITGPIAEGEVITRTRLLTGQGSDDGRVGVPIRVADAEIAAFLAPGDVVDVVAVIDGVGRRIATSARVVTVPRRSTTFGSGSGSGAATGSVVIVAVAPESALTLASQTTPVGLILRTG